MQQFSHCRNPIFYVIDIIICVYVLPYAKNIGLTKGHTKIKLVVADHDARIVHNESIIFFIHLTKW